MLAWRQPLEGGKWVKGSGLAQANLLVWSYGPGWGWAVEVRYCEPDRYAKKERPAAYTGCCATIEEAKAAAEEAAGRLGELLVELGQRGQEVWSKLAIAVQVGQELLALAGEEVGDAGGSSGGPPAVGMAQRDGR